MHYTTRENTANQRRSPDTQMSQTTGTQFPRSSREIKHHARKYIYIQIQPTTNAKTQARQIASYEQTTSPETITPEMASGAQIVNKKLLRRRKNYTNAKTPPVRKTSKKTNTKQPGKAKTQTNAQQPHPRQCNVQTTHRNKWIKRYSEKCNLIAQADKQDMQPSQGEINVIVQKYKTNNTNKNERNKNTPSRHHPKNKKDTPVTRRAILKRALRNIEQNTGGTKRTKRTPQGNKTIQEHGKQQQNNPIIETPTQATQNPNASTPRIIFQNHTREFITNNTHSKTAKTTINTKRHGARKSVTKTTYTEQLKGKGKTIRRKK